MTTLAALPGWVCQGSASYRCVTHHNRRYYSSLFALNISATITWNIVPEFGGGLRRSEAPFQADEEASMEYLIGAGMAVVVCAFARDFTVPTRRECPNLDYFRNADLN